MSIGVRLMTSTWAEAEELGKELGARPARNREDGGGRIYLPAATPEDLEAAAAVMRRLVALGLHR